MENQKNEGIFPALTGVRAIAAYMVFFHHYIGACHAGSLLSFVKEFYTGVTIFFVLSGFLIYYRYANTVRLDRDFLFDYLRNRFSRIYPVYFFIVFITFLLNFYNPINGGIANQITLLLLQLTFIRGFFDTYKFIGVGQGWTLTVEESFYVLFPFIIMIIRKWGFLIAVLATGLVGVFLTGLGGLIQFHGFFSPPRFVVNYTFFGRFFEFFCGMYMARILLAKGIKKSNGFIPTFTMLGLIGVFAGIFLMSKHEQACDYGNFYIHGMVINNLILPLFICLLFYGLIIENTVIRKFLASPLMILLGKASYVFYLIHVGIIQSILEYVVSSNMFVIFIIMNILAVVLHLLLEEPARRFIRRVHL